MNACRLAEPLAVAGDAAAQTYLAICYTGVGDTPGDPAASMMWLQRAAAQSYPGAQYLIGDRYMNGRGVPINQAEALKWYVLAADGGNGAAATWAAHMYYFGLHVPRDYKNALKYLLIAAKQNFEHSQYLLGKMYADGVGVSRNLVEAYVWFSIGASNDSEKAVLERDRVRRLLTSAQIATAQARAGRCVASRYVDCQPPAE